VFPFAYVLTPQKRYAAGATVAYYAAATPSIVAGTIGYLGFHVSSVLYGLLFWAVAVLCGSLPWILLYHRRCAPLSAIAALTILILPPLSLITVGHPLTAAGRCFPGLAWAGLLIPIAALLCFRKAWGIPTAITCIILGIAAHRVSQQPPRDPAIVVVNTTFGNPLLNNRDLLQQTSALLNTALAHPGQVLLFPEAAFPMWSRDTDTYWKAFLNQLARQHTSVIVGTSLPVPHTNANYNTLITRGYGLHGAYVQRVPVPFMMWQPGSRSTGYPSQLRAFSYMDVRGRHAAVLLCYEQLLAWPALQSLARHPEMLLAPSNQYWAARTNIPAIQHVAVQNWADLFGIPLYEAHNR
jgi:hypothetical protein